MALTRIENNQISNAVSGNSEVGINGNLKLQEYTVTGTRLANNLNYGSDFTATGTITGGNIATAGTVTATGNIITAGYFLGNIACATGYNSNSIYNGTSNVLIGSANGNITMSVDNNPNVVVVTPTTLQTNNFSTSGNAIIGGDLVVNGNLAYVNVTDLNVEDPIIGLGRGPNNDPLTTDDGKDRGEQLWYYAGSEKSAFTGYDNSAGKLIAATDVSIANEIVTVNSYGSFVVGNLEGQTTSVTGNTTAGNILTGGLVSATGNITGNYILGNGSQLANTGQHFRFTNVNNANYIVDGIYNDPPISLLRGQTYYFDMAAGNSHPMWIKTAPTLGTGNAYTSGVTNNGINSGQITFQVPWDAPNLLYYQCQFHTGMGGYLQIVDGTMLQNGNSTVTVYGNGNVGTSVSNVANVTLVTATGLLVTGTVSANGTITGGNLEFGSGTVSGTGNIYADTVFANVSGNITGNVDAAGNNTEVQFNDNGILGASAGFTFNTSGNVLTVNGNINSVIVSASGNITGGNIDTAGLLSGGNIVTGGTVSASGSVTGGNVFTGGVVSATGTGTFGNITTGGTVSAQGNIQGGNLLTGGLISVTGNVTADYFFGNGSQLTGIDTNLIKNGDSNVRILTANGNISMDVNATSNVVVVTDAGINLTGLLSASGNVTGQNLFTAGAVSATGDVSANNVRTSNVISTGQLDITSGSNGNILIQPNGSGNIILSNTYINSVAYPVQDQDAASKIYVDNLVSTAISYHEAVYVATNTDLATITGGTITYNQPNGAGNGIGATLTTTGSFNLIDTGNVQTVGTRILVKNEANATHNGIYVWSNATVITRSSDADTAGVGNAFALGLNDYFFVQDGNVNQGSAWIVDAPTGTITFGTSNIEFAQFSQSQVYTANTQAGLSLVNQEFSAKVDNNTTAFDGSGNIIVKAGANLTTPNIGQATGTSLSLTGNVVSGNVFTGGEISAVGTAHAGNLHTSGIVTATGNIIGANILTGGAVSATGNINGGNIISGNAVVGNINVSGDIVVNSLTANTTISAGGTVTGGNLATGGTMSASGNVTGGNVLTGGAVSATGTVTGGNIATAGTVSATGNITGNYFFGNGSQLTGIDTTLISNGNSNVQVYANGNVAVSITGTSNTVVFTSTGVSAVGNVTGNIILGANAVFGTSYTPTTGATITVNATDSVLLPVGNTLQRPTGATGMVRFNTTENQLEVYNGASWVGVGAFTAIGDDQFAGDGSTIVFVLSSTQTTDSCIVSINGVVQIPTTAYTVSGTNLTFTEAPQPGDDIDVRTITSTTTVTGISNSPGNAAISVSDTSNVIAVTGAMSATGNITGTYFLGNGSQLTGIDATSIQNGTANVRTFLNGNVTTSAGGQANVFVVTSNSATINGDLTVTGNASISGNISGSQISSGTTAVQIPVANGNVDIDVGGINNLAVFTTGGLSIVGNVVATGNVTAQDVNSLSDVTLKTNIQPISGIESVLFGLNGYEYDWKNGSGHSYGFLAQEVEKVLPNAVKTGADGLKAINYMMIIPFLVETIKQMGAEIKDLKQTVIGRDKK